ncbi:unnamed protein product [Rotaria socialis]|uniref:EDR1/CTR1/ARMC3-like peptidase-like domain-containing protein n=1 Tax=Rotaria socialis TaxID=392032 RepID=A0A820S8P0_9BILA|nr:unnamed protein product [Rotaria socialis]CAF4244419.1 unnamed protein product [Rotaria socialis]CAF4446532.1 unnamed protein product [Rotaria socialis]CAF4610009.1 unnamed protein product [Rotaria socialis]
MVKGAKPTSSAAPAKTAASATVGKGGKPRQQDEKAIDETFEPLKLDIKGAQTAVVCLRSAEDSVLIRACDALFKYAEKSDANKLMLHEMGATDTLFTLTHHENQTVQRNATMVFGLLSAHPDIRRHLRKIDCIPHMISLLTPENEPLTNEFAVYWLRYMCSDYSTKSQVLSLNVLQPLIRLISEADPDIKFNSLSTIDHILDDFHARSLVRELNGIEPILNNLKSEFPQITETVCNCLQKLATDPFNRAVIRDIGGLDKMIDFIGLDETKDVHVHCLNALANLLEDTECLDLIQSNGGLKRLMQFVQDSVVPAVQAAAAKAIGRAARKRLNTGPEPQNRKIFAEQDAERAMVFLLLSENDDVRIAACQALAVMAESMLSRETIRNNDGILTLVQMMQKENPRLREFSTLAMSNLTQSNPNNIRELQDQAGLDVLIGLLNDEKDTTKAYACVTLANCSTDQVVRTNILEKGLIKNLLAPLQASYELAQAKGAMVLSAFSIDQKAREDILKNQAIIPHLVSLLKSNHDEVRRNTCFAITVLCVEQTIAIEILRNGALEIIRDLNTSESRKSKFTEMALQKILDSHLSAKYSYLGQLENNNITTDGFYDMGPVREGGKFLTIEELAAEEVNDRRPILLVYAPEKNVTSWSATTGGSYGDDIYRVPSSSDDILSTSATPVKGSESKEKLSTGVSGRNAKTPKSSSKEKEGKTRAKKDKTSDKRDSSEDKKHGERESSETTADLKSGYKQTIDQDFQMYLDEIHPQILRVPLSEQISTLARFVSEKMGGTISPDDVATFGYEVAMNQLKAELHSNVVPIGRVRKGIHAQRAFLFKSLADRIGIPCTLTRGNYNRAWNEVVVGESSGYDEKFSLSIEDFRLHKLQKDSNQISIDYQNSIDKSTKYNPFDDESIEHIRESLRKLEQTYLKTNNKQILGVRYPAKTWIVDLLHEPGRLILANSSDARSYTILN